MDLVLMVTKGHGAAGEGAPLLLEMGSTEAPCPLVPAVHSPRFRGRLGRGGHPVSPFTGPVGVSASNPASEIGALYGWKSMPVVI